jgi:3D (Asp-Asp-Asp) domain-containing protein
MGDMVLIENMGLFRIEDRMNARWKRRIDILHGNPKAAMLFGKKKTIITWIGKG